MIRKRSPVRFPWRAGRVTSRLVPETPATGVKGTFDPVAVSAKARGVELLRGGWRRLFRLQPGQGPVDLLKFPLDFVQKVRPCFLTAIEQHPLPFEQFGNITHDKQTPKHRPRKCFPYQMLVAR